MLLFLRVQHTMRMSGITKTLTVIASLKSLYIPNGIFEWSVLELVPLGYR
jgi:hypothetical protein